MTPGHLSDYFDGYAVKRLSAVETDRGRSNQHEFNGETGLRQLLGDPDGKQYFRAKLRYLSETEDTDLADEVTLTWYDARERARVERGVERWEARLYYKANEVMNRAEAGDLLVVAKLRRSHELLVLVAQQSSTIEAQLQWLFGHARDAGNAFSVRQEFEEDRRVGFSIGEILETIGIVQPPTAPNFPDGLLTRFTNGFPTTREFSDYARSTLPDVYSVDDPDAALTSWMDREELLFRTFERHLLVSDLADLQSRGEIDPDAFMSLALSYQNRRKSRGGKALENHLEQVFIDHGITYSREQVTEGKHKPDFVLPSIDDYRNEFFDSSRLTAVASKTTCKDRWRQILNEAARIPDKHLVTLEPAISESQTDEMIENRVRLVLPASLHDSYSPSQQKWIMSISDLLQLLQRRQTR